MSGIKHQILEPLSSMIELSLLNFSHERPKLLIKNHGIMISNPGEGYIPRKFTRLIDGAGKEDLAILNPMIINYLKWFVIEGDDSIFYIYKNIAICAVHGMQKLQKTYEHGNVVLALQYYINIIFKSLIDVETNRANIMNISKYIHPLQPIMMDGTYEANAIMKSSQLNNSVSSPRSEMTNKIQHITEEESACNDSNSSNDNDNNIGDSDSDSEEVEIVEQSQMEEKVPVPVHAQRKTYFDDNRTITSTNALDKWTFPTCTDASLVDIKKIRQMWDISDLKNIYDMLQGCFDMSVDYAFVPKKGPVVNAKVKALNDVLRSKDAEFHAIIKHSYGGN